MSDITLTGINHQSEPTKLVLHAKSIQGYQRLRVFVRASSVFYQGFGEYFVKTPIGEFSDTYRDQTLDLVVANASEGKVFWGDPAKNMPLREGPNKARIIFEGPDGEQLAKFLVVLAGKAGTISVVTPGHISDLMN